MSAHTDPEIGRASDPEGEEPISLPTWAHEADPLQPVPSHSRYEPPDAVVASRRRARSVAAWYAQAGMGHSVGLGYVVLTLRELSGLSQSRLAARASTSQPAIARLESGRHVPSVNTLLKIASACGMHRRPRRSQARRGRPLHARPDAPRDPAAVLGRPSGLLRHPRASALDRRRMSRSTAARSVGESPITSIAAP